MVIARFGPLENNPPLMCACKSCHREWMGETVDEVWAAGMIKAEFKKSFEEVSNYWGE